MIRRPRPLGALLSLLFLLSPFVPTDVSAQPVELAADLIPGLPAAGFLSTPRSYGTFGDRAVFETFDGLWISDGTATGTYPLGSSCSICREDPRFFKASSSRLYWLAAAPLGERLLWSSDGSPRGAAPVDVMATFEAGVRPEALFVSGDAIYFSAFREPSHGIFRYRPGDGEPLRLVTSLASRFFASLGEFAELGGRVYFFAADETGSPGFWRTDGTVAGSVRLFDFGHGSQQDPFGLTRVGDRLYFFASLGGGIDLWVSDGSGAPPQRLTDFRDFSTLPHNGKVLPWAGGACFLGEQPNGAFGLWTTDGTAEGTEPLTNFSSTGGIPSFFGGDVLAVVGDSVLFAARANSGREVTLFRVEAGVPGVQQVVAGDRAPVLPTNDFGFRVANGRAYFPVEDASVQRALWFSDGTDAGTQSIETVCGTACGGILQAVERFDETLLFLRGSGAGPTSLWRTDGTPGGSRQLLGEAFHDFPPQLFSSWIGRAADGYLLPTELPGQGRVLAKVEDDGTAAVAWPLERFPEGSTPTDLEPFGQELAFVAQRPIDFVFQRGLFAISPESLEVRDLLEGSAWDPFDRPGDVVGFGDHLSFRSDRFEDLWVTDGTPEGTLQLWQAELFNQRLIFQTPFLDELLFGFSVEPSGCEIWQSDGSAAGTRRLLELAAESCGLGFPKALGNAVYFWSLTSGDPERQSVVRFRPDTGEMRAITPARNVSLVTFDPDPGFRELGGEIYFFFDDGLWKVGPSAADAVRIAGLGDSSAKSAFAELGGQLFLLTREFRQLVLWRTDGSAQGTAPVRTWEIPRELREIPMELVAASGRLWFPAYGDAAGLELWSSDGSAAGTVLSGDLDPGPDSSAPRDLAVAGDGRLVFRAADRFHGDELWTVDGAGGTPRLLEDLNPGPAHGTREFPVVFDGDLWFSGDDGLTGLELYRARFAPGAELCHPSPQRLCLQDGRFAVEARWRNFQEGTGSGQAVQLTPDTGNFWFFSEENVEAILKVLDGRPNNNHFWTFYGALSNVEYFLTVRDAETGSARRYFNPLRGFASVGDTFSFGPRGAGSLASLTEALETAPAAEPVVVESFDASAVGEGCAPTSTRLCLQEGRFAVEARWTDFRGQSGVGQAVPLTGDTGYFWFFRDSNVETVLKVLDGRSNNGNFWVFYGALSNVDYDLIVTDCETGAVRTYLNRGRTFASVGDTMAFPGS